VKYFIFNSLRDVEYNFNVIMNDLVGLQEAEASHQIYGGCGMCRDI
jgi:hypothetical protein